MRKSFDFIAGKPVDEPSDVAMSLHDSLSRMACKRKYLIKMMAVKARQTKAGQRRKERYALYYLCFSCRGSFASSRRTRNRDRNHQYGRLGMQPPCMSGIYSHPICTNSWIRLCLSNDDEHVCCPAALLCLWLQHTKAIGLHDGGQRYLLPIDCYKPTCYMYGSSLSITDRSDRSVDMYTVHSFKNKLNLAS